jgi:hypothetical protein
MSAYLSTRRDGCRHLRFVAWPDPALYLRLFTKVAHRHAHSILPQFLY